MENTQTTIQQDCIVAGRPELAAGFVSRGLSPEQARQELLAEVAASKPGSLAQSMRATLRARGVTPADEKASAPRGHHHHDSGGSGPRLRQVESMRAYLKARGITPADEVPPK